MKALLQPLRSYLCFALLLIFLVPSAQAQQLDTIEWAPQGATWLYHNFCRWCREDTKVAYEGDSIINGQLVKRMNLYGRNYVCGPDTNGSGTWICAPVIDRFVRTDFLFNRNDSIFWLKNGQFELLYCFAASVGNSWAIPQGYPFNTSPCSALPNNDSVVISKVDTLTFSGKKFISYNTNSIHNKWGIGTVIQNIGSLLCPFTTALDSNCSAYSSNAPTIFSSEGLSCYYDSKRGYIDFSASNHLLNCHGEITAVYSAERNKDLSFVFPNPANRFIEIHCADFVGGEIEIIDVLGRTQQKSMLNSAKQIDISELPEGAYTIVFQRKSQPAKTLRFVKQ